MTITKSSNAIARSPQRGCIQIDGEMTFDASWRQANVQSDVDIFVSFQTADWGPADRFVPAEKVAYFWIESFGDELHFFTREAAIMYKNLGSGMFGLRNAARHLFHGQLNAYRRMQESTFEQRIVGIERMLVNLLEDQTLLVELLDDRMVFSLRSCHDTFSGTVLDKLIDHLCLSEPSYQRL